MKATTTTTLIASFVVGILLGTYGTYRYLSIPTKPEPTDRPLAATSHLNVTLKETPEDSDLVVTQKYVATINNKKVEVPVIDKTTPASASTASATSYTATLQQEVDITPLVAHMVPRWELGVGLGRQEGGNTYIPVSVQRNYTYNKAVQVELHIDPRNQKVSGVEIQHKWRF